MAIFKILINYEYLRKKKSSKKENKSVRQSDCL